MKMLSLPQSHRTKLLARQLWHLALADILAFSVLTGVRVHELLALKFDVNGSAVLCMSWRVANFGILTSALVEAHIALVSLLAISRSRVVLARLARILGIVWPIGIIFSVADTYEAYTLGSATWDKQNVSCRGNNFWSHGLRNYFLLASLAICGLAYIAGILKLATPTANGAVRHRAVYRAMLFLLGTIIAEAPNVAAEEFFPDVWPGTTSFGNVLVFLGDCLFRLGGLINICVYVILSRRARRIMVHNQVCTPEKRPSATSGALSFPVAFGGTDEVDIESDQQEARRVAADAVGRLDAKRQAARAQLAEALLECFDEPIGDSEDSETCK